MFVAYASPNAKGGKEDKRSSKELTSSNATTPVEGNGFLKVSPSQGQLDCLQNNADYPTISTLISSVNKQFCNKHIF